MLKNILKYNFSIKSLFCNDFKPREKYNIMIVSYVK